jgi:hypothetical protein
MTAGFVTAVDAPAGAIDVAPGVKVALKKHVCLANTRETAASPARRATKGPDHEGKEAL